MDLRTAVTRGRLFYKEPEQNNSNENFISCPSVGIAFKRIIDACDKSWNAAEANSEPVGVDTNHSGEIGTEDFRAAEPPTVAKGKPQGHEAARDSRQVRDKVSKQPNNSIFCPFGPLENQQPGYGNRENGKGALTNWDRLAEDDTEGLLLSLLRLK